MVFSGLHWQKSLLPDTLVRLLVASDLCWLLAGDIRSLPHVPIGAIHSPQLAPPREREGESERFFLLPSVCCDPPPPLFFCHILFVRSQSPGAVPNEGEDIAQEMNSSRRGSLGQPSRPSCGPTLPHRILVRIGWAS